MDAERLDDESEGLLALSQDAGPMESRYASPAMKARAATRVAPFFYGWLPSAFRNSF